MDNQKIVVVLLLITIILSVVSVVLTLGVNLPELKRSQTQVQFEGDPVGSNAGNVQLAVEASGAG